MKDTNKKDLTNFFENLYHACQDEDAYIEVVINYTKSKYFKLDALSEAIEFSIEEAKKGKEIHFGPSIRKRDLNKKRSSEDNVHSSAALFVDIDAPDKTAPAEEQKAESKKLLDKFLLELKKYDLEPTYIIESGHGFHVYFVFNTAIKQPSKNWNQMQGAMINFAKSDKLVQNSVWLLRVPGTINYKDRKNPLQVRIISSSDKKYSESDFKQLVEDHGSNKKVQHAAKESEIKPLGFMPPCISKLLDPENKPPLGHRHQVRQVLSTYAFNEGWPIEDTIQKVMHTTDDPKKAAADVRNIYKALKSDPKKYSVGCGEGSHLRNLVDDGITVCDKDNCQFGKLKNNKKKDKEKRYSASLPGLVDLVLDNNKVKYLIKENGSLHVKDKHELPDCILMPPQAAKIPWQIARANEVLKHFNDDNDQQLYRDLVEYHRSISELPDNNHYKFLACWVMHTYMYDRFPYSPIIWFYAIPARGKSRTAKGIIYASFRGVILTTIREAHLIRLATDHRATLFFDIMDLQRKIERSGAEDILLARFESGAKVPRVLHPEKGAFNDTKYYEIYGPTIMATNETIHEILETRSIQIVMPETSRIFPDDVKESNGLPFRERLVAFRARWLDHQLPIVEKPVIGRLGDILKPIRQIINMVSQDESWFLEFTKKVEESRKKDALDSKEAKVVNAIKECEYKIDHGHLLNKDILDVINEDRPEQYHMSPQGLGRITKRLGFKKYNSGEARGIEVDQRLLYRLCQRYGIYINDGEIIVK
jgi:hypothetical protein